MTNENEQACNADLILRGQDDLIRRGDAHDAVRNTVSMSDALDAIAALPAVAASQPADPETCGCDSCMGITPVTWESLLPSPLRKELSNGL